MKPRPTRPKESSLERQRRLASERGRLEDPTAEKCPLCGSAKHQGDCQHASSEQRDAEESSRPLFRPARGSASTAVRKSLTDRDGITGAIRESFAKATGGTPAPTGARQYLHQVSDSTQRHPVAELKTPADGHTSGTSQDKGGAYTRVQPATSIGDFIDQQVKLITAFREAEGRDPREGEDAGFWEAFRTITVAFAELGSYDRATEMLNTGNPTPVKKRRKLAAAQSKRSAANKARIAELSPVAKAADITAYRR